MAQMELPDEDLGAKLLPPKLMKFSPENTFAKYHQLMHSRWREAGKFVIRTAISAPNCAELLPGIRFMVHTTSPLVNPEDAPASGNKHINLVNNFSAEKTFWCFSAKTKFRLLEDVKVSLRCRMQASHVRSFLIELNFNNLKRFVSSNSCMCSIIHRENFRLDSFSARHIERKKATNRKSSASQ